MHQVNEQLKLPEDRKTLLICDAFRAQECPAVLQRLEELHIVYVQISRAFSDDFTNCITLVMLRHPNKDVTRIEIDLRVNMKPLHAKRMGEIYNHFQTKRMGEIYNHF